MAPSSSPSTMPNPKHSQKPFVVSTSLSRPLPARVSQVSSPSHGRPSLPASSSSCPGTPHTSRVQVVTDSPSSEFGNRTPEAPPPGPLAGKANFQKELRNLGLPYALIWCGPFADFNPFFLTYARPPSV
jgi:hypothetical protein